VAKRWTGCLLALSVCVAAAAGGEEGMFPFVISYDAPSNATNVSAWLEKPAGKHGFVRAKREHFATDAGRIRFWATNLCFGGCFPSHEQAERVAARLARFGINCVRMHHMDARDIWGKSADKLTIDPARLERLDYLIYQLKLHGIYTNLNLHVSRWFGDKEGFPHRDQRPKYDKGLGNFEPRMVELQKKYARDLLTHTNPYTKTPYTREPAIAFVEISNEDALFAVWSRNQLDSLPDPYATTFRKLWNAWLRKEHGSTAKLRTAWNVGSEALGAELLTNGDFAQPLAEPWHMERDAACKVAWSLHDGGPDGRRFLRVVVEKKGERAWVPQFMHNGIPFTKGQSYTLSFQARCDRKRAFGVNNKMAHEPWKPLGFYSRVEAGPQWTQVRRTFVASDSDANARITFSGLEPGTYELAAVSLRPGGIVGLEAGQTLEDDSVPTLKHGLMSVTEAARNDWIDFLWDSERDYWWGMYGYLKDDLKVEALVAGTQLSYSPVHVQAWLDFIDAHSYWQHPRFPGRPWDRGNWYVRNVALVNSPPGTLGSLAARRVYGKPFTVSEYNHPTSLAYEGEGFPMIAAFGAFQDWDGIYSFAYCHNDRFEPRRVESYFDIKGNTVKMAHQIACAAMFLRGDVAAGGAGGFVHLPRERERQTLQQSLSAWGLAAKVEGWPDVYPLMHKVGFVIDEAAPPSASAPLPPELGKVYDSSTKEIRWDVSQAGAGAFTVSTPRSKLFTGFPKGRACALGDVGLVVRKAQLGWATLTMTCLDGEGFAKPGRILIVATGAMRNTGAKLEDLGRGRVTLGRKWGTEPVLCEGVAADVVLPVAPGRVAFYPLDESGSRREAARVAESDGKALLRLGPEHKTVWYEAVVK